jgi:very-short-patch-repair endonuclease
MHSELERLVDEGDGVMRRADVRERAPLHVVDYAVASGRLLRPVPRTYLSPDRLSDPNAVLRLAVAYAAAPVAVSHLSALRLWGLPTPASGWVHLMTADHRHVRGALGVRVHRRKDFVIEPPAVVQRNGFWVTRLETSVVDSWPLLDGDAKRAPAIAAVAQRMTTAQRIRTALDDAPRLAGRRLLVQLLDRLERGCHSALELWGYDQVFHGPQFARLRWQVPQRVGEHSVYLDALDEQTGVNIELDGAAYHSSSLDRERDLRRDAALMALGFTVVRFTGSRLRRDPLGVRQEALAIINARRPGRT